jgi:predicted RNA-binding Zn ribbon-like protein
VEFASYAEGAIDLVNAQLDSLEDLRRHLGERPWLTARAKPADLSVVKRLQAELAAIVDASAAQQDSDVVRLLNDALEKYPISPRLSGHDNQPWHLHVGDTHANVTRVLAAEALFGLAVLVSTLGPTRLGRCAAEDCNAAYLDTSPNHSRRYCSTRCATRTNVAAHRRRSSRIALR